MVRRLRSGLNEQILEQLLAVAETVQARLPDAGIAIDGMLGFRGVIDVVEGDETADARVAREAVMLDSLGETLDALGLARRDEGERLGLVLLGQLDEAERLLAAARAAGDAQPAAIQERFRQQVAALMDGSEGIPEDRLAQEVTLLAVKADVREELDRLAAHVAAARELLQAGGAAGRRLDFLAQEFNREANTLLSKSSQMELTRLGLDLKTLADQFREQAQNIE